MTSGTDWQLDQESIDRIMQDLRRPGSMIPVPPGLTIKQFAKILQGVQLMWDPLMQQREFCKAMEVPTERKPTIPDRKLQGLCRSLIVEEFHELETEYLKLQNLWEQKQKGSIGEQEADALSQIYIQNMCAEMADLIYVICQQANVYGMPLREFYNAIHKANMAKVAEDGKVKRREDGKVLKPDGWEPANLDAIYLRARSNGAPG